MCLPAISHGVRSGSSAGTAFVLRREYWERAFQGGGNTIAGIVVLSSQPDLTEVLKHGLQVLRHTSQPVGVYEPPLGSWWSCDWNWPTEFSGCDAMWPLRLGHKRGCSFYFTDSGLKSWATLWEDTLHLGCHVMGKLSHMEGPPIHSSHQVFPGQVTSLEMISVTSSAVTFSLCTFPVRPRCHEAEETSHGVLSCQNSWPMKSVSIIKWWLFAPNLGVLFSIASS